MQWRSSTSTTLSWSSSPTYYWRSVSGRAGLNHQMSMRMRGSEWNGVAGQRSCVNDNQNSAVIRVFKHMEYFQLWRGRYNFHGFLCSGGSVSVLGKSSERICEVIKIIRRNSRIWELIKISSRNSEKFLFCECFWLSHNLQDKTNGYKVSEIERPEEFQLFFVVNLLIFILKIPLLTSPIASNSRALS